MGVLKPYQTLFFKILYAAPLQSIQYKIRDDVKTRDGSLLLRPHAFLGQFGNGLLQSVCTVDLRRLMWIYNLVCHPKLWLAFLIGSSGSKQTFPSQAWLEAGGPSKRVQTTLCQRHSMVLVWGPTAACGHYAAVLFYIANTMVHFLAVFKFKAKTGRRYLSPHDTPTCHTPTARLKKEDIFASPIALPWQLMINVHY